MSQDIYSKLNQALIQAVKDLYDVRPEDFAPESPPEAKLGDLAFTAAFDLARHAKKPPRKIAEELAPKLRSVEGVAKVEIAGPGYLNVFFDRRLYLERFSEAPDPVASTDEKIIVEHTNINPNKAAHIGHLRNAALGDTFVRVLRYLEDTVEIQNYIDDTGVQVADVVVGFLHLEKKTADEVKVLTESDRFDYYCWDLYAQVNEFYLADPERQIHRQRTLQAIEEGTSPEALLAHEVATRIVLCHLSTMERIGVRYDLLPWEGDILRLQFWNRAFELLKEKQAIFLTEEGKNTGCWVMDLPEESDADGSDEKVIVRSNGTVTYVGKDIAYQMWKLGLLGQDFFYVPFHRYDGGAVVWSTTSREPEEVLEAQVPKFGHGDRVYNVIDTRQSYLQRIVQQGVALLASEQARERSRHFAYEMVALTPATCRELGFPVSEDEAKKPYLEVSGRKGLGVKADDLIDVLEKKALEEVAKRNAGEDEQEQKELARAIARAALRYFMVKTTKNKVIAFDFAEALSFEGDSGPYLQYAAVRAGKIVQKMGLDSAIESADLSPDRMRNLEWKALSEEESDELWSLVHFATRLGYVAEQVKRTEEPAHLARFALQLAQKFNAFYHRYPILKETDPAKQSLRLLVVQVFRRQISKALALMGIPVPERM